MNKKTFINIATRILKNKLNSRRFLTMGFTPLEIEYPMACREDNRQNNLANGGLFPFKDKFLTGFTLMELLVYTAIFVVAAAFMTGIMITTLRVGQHESASAEVTDQLNFVMQTISRLTKESSAIIVNGTSNDTSLDGVIGNAYPRLILRMKDSNGGVSDRDPIVIWNNNGVINESEGAGANQKTNILTNSKVNADNLQFTKFTQYPGHDTVSINLQLSYKSQNPSSQFTKTLQSAIARVSAATFDADVLPGASSYNLGQNNSPWQNIYMQKGTANSPSYTFDRSYDPTSIVGMFNPSANVLGFSTNGTERMRIDNNGYVGIGTTTPNNNLSIGSDGKVISLGQLDPLTGMWIRNDGSNTVISTNKGDMYYGYSGNNKNLYFFPGGTTPALSVDSVGNVGIGAAPAYKLDVNGDIRAQNAFLRTTGASGWYNDTYGGGWYMTDGNWVRSYGDKGVWTGGGALGSDAGLTIGYAQAVPPTRGAIFAGNVGIGTNVTGNKLDVNGNASISGTLTAKSGTPIYQCPTATNGQFGIYGNCSSNPCVGQLQTTGTCYDVAPGGSGAFCVPTVSRPCALYGRMVNP